MKSCNIVATRFFTICVLFCYLRLDESVDSAGVMIWWRLITPELTWRKGRQTSLLSRICTVVQYAVLEAMTTVNGKTENSTSRKYKMDKDIQTPHRIYDYVAELSCCAQSEQNRLTQFCWGNMGSLSFLLTHTQASSQTNSFISPTDHKYGRIWNIYGSKRVVSRPDVPFWVSLMTNHV